MINEKRDVWSPNINKYWLSVNLYVRLFFIRPLVGFFYIYLR